MEIRGGLSEPHDNSGAEVKVVLRVVGRVGKLRAEVVGFKNAKGDAGAKGESNTAARFDGDAIGCRGRVPATGKHTVHCEGFADQPLRIDAVARVRRRPCVARPKSGRNEVETDTGRVDIGDVCPGDVGHPSPATVKPSVDLRAAALHPEVRAGDEIAECGFVADGQLERGAVGCRRAGVNGR